MVHTAALYFSSDNPGALSSMSSSPELGTLASEQASGSSVWPYEEAGSGHTTFLSIAQGRITPTSVCTLQITSHCPRTDLIAPRLVASSEASAMEDSLGAANNTNTQPEVQPPPVGQGRGRGRGRSGRGRQHASPARTDTVSTEATLSIGSSSDGVVDNVRETFGFLR